MMDEEAEHELTREAALSLLNSPFIPTWNPNPEELHHPWGNPRSVAPTDKPLLRVWDHFSGSQPDESNRMISRLPRGLLNTWVLRSESLHIHAKQRDYEPLSFISLTTSTSKLEELVKMRAHHDPRRGPHAHYLTVVNPNVRVRLGLPIVKTGDEMDYYEVRTPYAYQDEDFNDEYLYLWEVTPSEIVGHWKGSDLVENERWYEEIVLPAFREHNEGFIAATGGLSDVESERGALAGRNSESEQTEYETPAETEVDNSEDETESSGTESDTHGDEDDGKDTKKRSCHLM